MKPIVFIITGRPGSGKTTFLTELIQRLREYKLSVNGFLAPRSLSEEQKQVYELHLLYSGESFPFASREPVTGWTKIDHFYFNPEAIITGNKILNNPQIINTNLIVVDEIGIFELEGKIWADAISRLTEKTVKSMIWVVRDLLVEKVKQRWDLQDPVIFDIKKVSVGQAEERILSIF